MATPRGRWAKFPSMWIRGSPEILESHRLRDFSWAAHRSSATCALLVLIGLSVMTDLAQRTRHKPEIGAVRATYDELMRVTNLSRSSILKWRDEDELFEAVNNVDFGLTGSIWTTDLDKAHRAARRIQTGYVWINNSSQHFLGAPFGDIKHSGIGREESFAEIAEFTYTKNINIKFR